MGGVAAWIVAVETHTPTLLGPSNLDFDVPLSIRGIRLAEWLIDKPDTRVAMNVSVGKGSGQRARLETLSARLLNPDMSLRADSHALKRSLTLLRAQAADMLILCWIGHGIMHDGKRYVLHEESVDPATLSSFEVESLLQRLRSADFPATQIGFFDTCAQVLNEKPGNEQLAGGRAVVRDQYYYFASTAGAFASASLDQAGLSDYAYEALKEIAWPPLPSALDAALVPRLNNLKSGSRPTKLFRTRGSGDLWSSGSDDRIEESKLFTHALASGLSLPLFEHLFKPLQPLGVDPNELTDALRNARFGRFVENLKRRYPNRPETGLLEDAWGLIETIRPWADLASKLGLLLADWCTIAHETAREDLRTAPSFVELKELLIWSADFPSDPQRGLKSLLRTLLLGHRRAAQLKKPEATLAAYLDQLVQAPQFAPWIETMQAEMPMPEDFVVMLLELSLPANAGEPQVGNVWIDSGSGVEQWHIELSREGFGEQVNELVNALRVQFDRPVRVEIVAPFDALCGPREWLSYNFDDPTAASSPPDTTRIWLEDILPISWRWQERLLGQRAALQPALWAQRAKAVRESALVAGHLRCAFDDLGKPARLSVNDHVRVLTYLPPSPTDLRRNRQQFVDAMLSGHPYMIWPRTQPGDAPAFQQQIKGWLGKMRLGELQNAEHPCPARTDNVIFMDDAERIPYPQSGFMVRQTGPAE